MPEKKGPQNPEMVDRCALGLRNVLINTFSGLILWVATLVNILLFSNWRTFLGPISVDLIFYTPNVANLGFCRIEPKIAF